MPTPFEAFRDALTGRYRIERELGRGATAIVYLAQDLRHGRAVALKVLNPELALAVRSERFLREIQTTARLNHPHILPLHDSGDANGTLFYVMPYVAGESLRDRLNREKQLPVDDALRIARDVASALTAAHAAGVVHRDIKPENILLDRSGEVFVADFGIARALTVAAGQTLTDGGIAPGTPAYMSPEQATGVEVDGRSDVYSLGCVTYEMLAGHPPFTGATTQEVLSRHLLDPVPSLRAARTAVPDSVESAIGRALAKQPADRFPTPNDFVTALSSRRPSLQASDPQPAPGRIAWALLAVILLVAAGVIGWKVVSARSGSGRSLAVMPFTPLSVDTTQSYFSQGMTEEITNQLARVERLRVVPITGEYLAKSGNSPQTIGADLGVSFVLSGAVRRDGDSLRISARLVDVNDGSLIWAETYAREMRNVFTVQEEIARAIVHALELKFAVTGAPLRRPTDNLEAYDLYLKGRYLYASRTPGSLPKALVYYDAAIAKDSNFALAWAGVAAAYNQMYRLGSSSSDQTKKLAETAADRALALDSDLAEAHTAKALVLVSYEWDFKGGEREFRQAIALKPNYPDAHAGLGFLLAGTLNQPDEGVEESRRAVKLDALSPQMHQNFDNTLRLARRYDEAIAEARRTIDLEPTSFDGRMRLADALLAGAHYPEAIAAYATADSVRKQVGLAGGGGGGDGGIPASLGFINAALGKWELALQAIQQTQQRLGRASTNRGGYVRIAEIYAKLGDMDQAFQWLDTAYQQHVYRLIMLPSAQGDVFRSDPRFAPFLKRMGLQP